MQQFLKPSAVAAMLVVCSLSAQADVKFDANIETNTTYKSGRDNPLAASTFDNGGRIEINANAELLRQGEYFVNARGSLLLGLNADTGIDDAWIQFGSSVWDFKLGRFEAVDLFPLGKDTLVESVAANTYRANVLRGRFKDDQFHGAVGLNASPNLRFELGLISYKGAKSGIVEQGVRPVAVYSNGALTLRAGIEHFDRGAGNQTGYGLSAGYAVSKEGYVNASYAKSSDVNASSFGLNATFGPAGVGLIHDNTAAGKSNTYYAAYSFPLFGVKGATITPAISHSTHTGQDGLTAVRVRLNYVF